MKRLTFEGNFCDIAMCGEVQGGSFCEDGVCSQRKIWEQLKKIEDILDSEYDLDLLRELAQADREGRCVVMPCKIGDTLYEIIRHRNSGTVEIAERTVLSVEKFQDDGYIKMQRWVPCHDTADILKQRVDSWAKIEDFGKTVFLSRKEAEAELRREQDG